MLPAERKPRVGWVAGLEPELELTRARAMVLDTVDRLTQESVWQRTCRILLPPTSQPQKPHRAPPYRNKKISDTSTTSSNTPIVKVN